MDDLVVEVSSAGCGLLGSLKVGCLVGQYPPSAFHKWCIDGLWGMGATSSGFEGCLDLIESLEDGFVAGLAVGHSFAYLFR